MHESDSVHVSGSGGYVMRSSVACISEQSAVLEAGDGRSSPGTRQRKPLHMQVSGLCMHSIKPKSFLGVYLGKQLLYGSYRVLNG